ncbi:MAG: hypothetical protein NTX00_02920 [Candidatus Parcubacteria bacterium]|nr:hypothetical protein [Candidatus Parcubacteria bacterium]
MAKFRGWENINLVEPQSFEDIKLAVIKVYEQNYEMIDEQIETMRDKLSQIPNLVINFDETMTMESTIDAVINGLCREIPDQTKDLITKRDKWQEKIKDKDSGSVVKSFYEEVIGGIDKDILEKVYDKVIEKMELNPNLEEVLKYLKEKKGINNIPLFILSLNNHVLIEKFYKRFEEYFKSRGVVVIGIMANQVVSDESGRVSSVIEHVNDENKHEFIPRNAIMLADSRETRSLLERGVNALNIQGEQFHPILLGITFKMIGIIEFLEGYRVKTIGEETQKRALDIFNAYFKLKKDWEQRMETDEEEIIKKEKLLREVDVLLQEIAKFENI